MTRKWEKLPYSLCLSKQPIHPYPGYVLFPHSVLIPKVLIPLKELLYLTYLCLYRLFPVPILLGHPTYLPVGVVPYPALWADLAGLRVEAGHDRVATPLPRDCPGGAAARSQLTLVQ